MRKKHHRTLGAPIARPLQATAWCAALPLLVSLAACRSETIAPDVFALASELRQVKPATNIPIDAVLPEVVPAEPEPRPRWKPVPKAKPKAWIPPTKKRVDVVGMW